MNVTWQGGFCYVLRRYAFSENHSIARAGNVSNNALGKGDMRCEPEILQIIWKTFGATKEYFVVLVRYWFCFIKFLDKGYWYDKIINTYGSSSNSQQLSMRVVFYDMHDIISIHSSFHTSYAVLFLIAVFSWFVDRFAFNIALIDCWCHWYVVKASPTLYRRFTLQVVAGCDGQLLAVGWWWTHSWWRATM